MEGRNIEGKPAFMVAIKLRGGIVESNFTVAIEATG
jgi:hypothetical protein